MRKRHIALFPAIICLMIILLFFPSPIHAYDDGPQLYNAQADPFRVNTGAQPVEHPVVLSVEVPGPGGEISSARIDLDRLTGAKFYDPLTDKIKDVDVDTPMHRVYEIEGKEAYLVGTKSTSASIYREYRKALTHERIKETNEIPDATNKWQVELPHAGNIECSTRLRVIATNIFNEEGYAFVPVEVVDDSNSPELSPKVKYPTKGSVARPGDRVTIEAKAADDSSGVFSVRLGGESARAIFGENPNLALTKGSAPDVWSVENTVAPDIEEGTYTIQVAAIDRAGNESTQTIDIEVKRSISSLQLDLQQGWNLISVPRRLEQPAVSKVFSDLPVESVRTMVGGEWLEVREIMPGLGYLVQSSEPATLTLDFEDFNPSVTPPSISFKPGWNLLGYATRTLEPKISLSFYLGRELEDKWLAVYTSDGEHARAKHYSPYIQATDGFPTITGEPYSQNPSENLPAIDLGKGYWVYFNDGGTLIP